MERLYANSNIVSSKYRCAEKSSDKIFSICIRITNLHIKWHPPRAADLYRHSQIQNRQYTIGEKTIMKRRRAQDKYHAKCRRLDLELYALEKDSSSFGSIFQ